MTATLGEHARLPGAGKTTLAQALGQQLLQQQQSVVVLDGDELRKGLTRDLGFSDADRAENMRRVAEVAKLFNQAGTHTLVALVSPSIQGRSTAKQINSDIRPASTHAPPRGFARRLA